MIIKEEIHEFAKNLFLEFSEDGSRKYSYRQISTAIEQAFNEKVNYTTVRNWSDKDRWEVLRQEAINRGIEKVVSESMEKEETIREAKSRESADIYKIHKAKHDTTGYLIFKVYEYYAQKLKKGEITVEQIPPDILRLASMDNYRALDAIERLSGDKQEDKIDQLMRKLDEI